ncbi:MAG: hypothetical protein VX583_02970 [Bdellovibrionota bacterium]|nr:hypothetical protein [Pseudobdellovibrionaceae bacterium]|tara:strand:- start:50580 stop:51284 length:705 start_codon:yes stop_codon:yes gene_type:complete
MKSAVLFANTGVLDFLELRTSIVRIPEVIAKLKEAQTFLDRAIKDAPDLIQFITSDDQVFWSRKRIRQIAVGIVQLGLYERYVKRYGEAAHLLASDKEENPVQVLSGKMRLGEYVINLAMREDDKSKVVSMEDQALLSKGISMPDFQLFQKDQEGFFVLVEEGKKQALNDLLMKLRDEKNTKQFVNIGPGQSISGSALNELVDKELNIMESIDLDPMLSWFWDISSPYCYQLAN